MKECTSYLAVFVGGKWSWWPLRRL